jgi:hypothetical protein
MRAFKLSVRGSQRNVERHSQGAKPPSGKGTPRLSSGEARAGASLIVLPCHCSEERFVGESAGRTAYPLGGGWRKGKRQVERSRSSWPDTALGTIKLAGTAVQVEAEAGSSGDTGVNTTIGRLPSPPLRPKEDICWVDTPPASGRDVGKKATCIRIEKRLTSERRRWLLQRSGKWI